jgi:hypothetical protein
VTDAEDQAPREESLFEIIQLENGDVVLRRCRGTDEPLVRLRFSAQMLDMLGDDLLDVAEAMLDAAADAVADLHERDDGEVEDGWTLLGDGGGPTLH